MDALDTLALKAVPAAMGEARIGVDDFIAAYNEGKCELIDIRVAEETAIWQFNIGLRIPADELPRRLDELPRRLDELPRRLDELPRDTMLVIACPMSDRSNMVRAYLAAKGFDARYLAGGLLGLADRLKGGGAKSLKRRP